MQNTYEPSRHDKRAVEPAALGDLAAEEPPKWMTRRQKALWADILSRAPDGLLCSIDRELFAHYVELVDRHERAVVAQAKLDARAAMPMLSGGSPLAVSPYLRVIDRTVLLMARLQSEMGFSPTARARLGQPQASRDPAADANVWAQLRRVPVIDGGKAQVELAAPMRIVRKKNGSKA